MITGEGNEENITQTGEVGANAGSAGAETNQEQQTVEMPTWQQEAINYAKEQGREVSNFDDLLKPFEVQVEKPVEVVKEVNPYEGILDEDDKAYFEYKKTTGNGRKEYDALNKNWDEVSKLELARERVRKENGLPNLSNDDADSYLSEQLGIDDINDLSGNDNIKLSGYAKPIIDAKKAEQEKYRQPAQNNIAPHPDNTAQPEYVKLPNGALMGKAQYEAEQSAAAENVKQAVEAVKTVKAADFKFSVDDNGNVRDVAIPYEYSEQDVQNMASFVSDITGTINKRYNTENGFNHAAFGEDMQWSDKNFREKAISTIAARVRAEAIEETMKRNGNHSFTPDKPIDKQTTEGVRQTTYAEIARRI